MDNILQSVSTYLKQEKELLADELLVQAVDELNLYLPNEHFVKHKELLFILLSRVSESLLFNKLETEEQNLEYDIQNYFYNSGTYLNDTIEIICTFRLSLMKEIGKKGFLEKSNSGEIARLYEKITFIFDEAIRDTTQNFNIQNQKSIEAIEKEIMTLSAPVVPIKEKIAVLPLIGDFNESRASYISTEVIPRIVQLNIELLVIDFSGMHVFDTFVAHHFFQIRDTLRLLGIESVVTGVRPSLAQTAVHLGINLNNIKSYNNVKQFLETLENRKEEKTR